MLLEANGQPRQQINLSFDHLSDLFLEFAEDKANNEFDKEMSVGQLDISAIKITDNDLVQFWEHLNSNFTQTFNLEGQDVGDETILKISQLYLEGKCAFSRLLFSGNSRISAVGIHKLGLSLQNFPTIKEINLHNLQIGQFGIKYICLKYSRVIELIGVSKLTNVDLGYIGNESLKYLSSILQNEHSIEELCFG